jgi:transposase-like protein
VLAQTVRNWIKDGSYHFIEQANAINSKIRVDECLRDGEIKINGRS